MEKYTVTIDGTTYSVPRSAFKSQSEAQTYLQDYFKANPDAKVVRQSKPKTNLGDLARVAAQGLTFGAADEIEARARTYLDPRTNRPEYAETVSNIRRSVDRAYEANPLLAAGVELAGSALPTLGLAALTAPAGGAGGAAAAGATAARTGAAASRAAGAFNKAITAQRTTGLGRTAALGAAEGAAYGFNTAEGDIAQRAPAAALAAGLGGVASGVSKIAQPKLTDAAKRLVNRGAAQTPEMLGLPAKGVLGALRNTPLVMGPARKRKEESLAAFNTLVGNEVLRPIGKRLGKRVDGENTYTATRNIITKSYDDVLAEVDAADVYFGTYSAVFDDVLQNMQSAGIEFSDKTLKKIMREVASLDVRFNSDSGKDFKGADSELRKLIESLRRKQDSNLGVAAFEAGKQADLLEIVRDAMKERAADAIGGNWAERLRATDFAYKQLMQIAKATKARGGDGEVFTPKQLRDAIKAGDLEGYIRGKSNPLLQIAKDADEVYGDLDYSTARDQATQSMLGLDREVLPAAAGVGLAGLGIGAASDQDYTDLAIGGGVLGTAALLMQPRVYNRITPALVAGGEPASNVLRTASPYLTGGVLGRMYENEDR